MMSPSSPGGRISQQSELQWTFERWFTGRLSCHMRVGAAKDSKVLWAQSHWLVSIVSRACDCMIGQVRTAMKRRDESYVLFSSYRGSTRILVLHRRIACV